MASTAPHAARSWIMHNAMQHLASLVVLSGRDEWQPFFGGKKTGMAHPQGNKDIVGAVRIQRHATDFFHQSAEHDVVDISINKFHSRWRDRYRGEGHVIGHVAASPGACQVQIGSKTGGVGEEIANSNVSFVILSEFRNVLRNRVIEANLTLFGELHDGGCSGYHFGQ